MAVFVDEFVEDEQAPLFVVPGNSRQRGTPGVAHAPPDSDLIRIRQRCFSRPHVQVVLHAEAVQVGPQIPVETFGRGKYRFTGYDGGEFAARGCRCVPIVPRLQRRSGRPRTPRFQHLHQPSLDVRWLDAERHGGIGDGRSAVVLRLCSVRHHHPAVGTVERIVSVDRQPQRSKRQKQAFALCAVRELLQQLERRRAHDGVAFEVDATADFLETCVQGDLQRRRGGAAPSGISAVHRGMLRIG